MGDIAAQTLGVSRSSASAGDDAVCGMVSSLEELAAKVSHLQAAVKTEGDILDRAISALRVAEQREILIMRYLDGMDWEDVVFCKYGGQADFIPREEDYRQAAYSLHNRAVAALSCAIARVA